MGADGGISAAEVMAHKGKRFGHRVGPLMKPFADACESIRSVLVGAAAEDLAKQVEQAAAGVGAPPTP